MVDHEQLQSDLLGVYLDGDQLLQSLLAAYQSAIVKGYWGSVEPIKKAIYAMRQTDREKVEQLVARATFDQTVLTEADNGET